MLNEINQLQKDRCCMVPFYEVPNVIKFRETESRMVVSREWLKWGKEEFLN
jgi:hypothetical protein